VRKTSLPSASAVVSAMSLDMLAVAVSPSPPSLSRMAQNVTNSVVVRCWPSIKSNAPSLRGQTTTEPMKYSASPPSSCSVRMSRRS
jgi:hypothetical protein